jgi:hypothetical protein
MQTVVAKVTIDDFDAAMATLRGEVVSRVSEAAGFVTGYWTRKEDTGLSMIVFDSEDAANAAAEHLRTGLPDAVTLESMEVREVVAHA